MPTLERQIDRQSEEERYTIVRLAGERREGGRDV